MENKVSLSLLLKLVDELQAQYKLAKAVEDSSVDNKHEYVAEVSKCMGLASAVSIEAAALTADFITDIKISSGGQLPADMDMLSKMMAPPAKSVKN